MGVIVVSRGDSDREEGQKTKGSKRTLFEKGSFCTWSNPRERGRDKKLLRKYLLVYLGLFMITLLGGLAALGYASQMAWKTTIQECETGLLKGAGELEAKLNTMYSFAAVINENSSVGSLNRVEGELPANQYVHLNYTQSQLKNLSVVGDFSYTFVMFARNSAFVSNQQNFADLSDYYSRLFWIDEMPFEKTKQWLFSGDGDINFFKAEEIGYYADRQQVLSNPVIITIRPISANGALDKTKIFVFVLSEQELADWFTKESALADCELVISDQRAGVLYASSEQAESLTADDLFLSGETEIDFAGKAGYLLQTELLSGSLQVMAVVKKEKIVEQVAGMLAGVRMLIWADAVWTVFAVLFLTWRRYTPTHRLIARISDRTDSHIEAANEYEYIEKVVDAVSNARDDYRERLARLQLQVNQSIVENVFTHGFYRPMDLEKLNCQVLGSMEYYYVVIFHAAENSEADRYAASLALQERLRAGYAGHCYQFHSGLNDEIFLAALPSDGLIDSERLGTLLEQSAFTVTKQFGIVFHIGVSGIGQGVEHIHDCYEQAVQAWMYRAREYENTIGYYHQVISETGADYLDMNILSQIYQSLLCGEAAPVQKRLERFYGHYRKEWRQYEGRSKESFYTMRHMIQSAGVELGMLDYVRDLPEWSPKLPLDEQVRALEQRILQLTEAYNKKKKSHNEELESRILDFMQAHFSDMNLSAAAVCQTMQISEKYLTLVVKERTGKTFSRYLEGLRIEEAKRLLRETKLSNSQIAERTGFGADNTFYRVFHKVVGISPKVYQQSQKEAQEQRE